MNQTDTQNFKKILLDKQIILKKRRAELKTEDPFSDTERIQDNAAIDAEAAEQSGHERIEAMQAEIDESLARIGRALVKIKEGTYGVCEGCKKVINISRIKVDPAARLCMDCEARHVVVEQ